MQVAEPITINAIIDAYMADKNNPHAERKCKTPKSIAGHFTETRKVWGALSYSEFSLGSKQRVKAQVQAWREAGVAQATCRKRISQLRTAFRFAVEELEIIDKVPNFKLPAPGSPRERFVDEERELPALLAAADKLRTPEHVRLFLELALRTGQRKGAILALRWQHVDLDRRVIRFRDTEAANERSKKRRGDKAMDDELLAIMREAFERRSDETEAVIHFRDKPVRNIYVAMKSLYRRAGVPDLWVHDLRRTSATYVHTATDGDIKAAATHIADTEATARKHYVQEDPRITLPGVTAVSGVLAKARANAA